MKLSLPNTKPKSGYQLCIGLEETPTRELDDVEKAISFTCHRVPGDTDSPKYKLKAYPYEDGASCEQYIKTFMRMLEVEKGQKIETNEDKVILVRQLFKGAALTAFETELPAAGQAITNAQLKKAFAAMPKVVFPDKALRNQKKALKRLKKPREMSFRNFANRVKVLNDYFPYFPVLPNGTTPKSLPQDELMELLHDALPKVGYQDVMQQHDYDPNEDSLQGFIDWIERRCEPFDTKSNNPPKAEKPIPKKKRGRDESKSMIRDEDRPLKKQTKWCLFHKHCDHTTDQCKVMQARAKEPAKPHKPWKDYKKKPGEDAHAVDEPMPDAFDANAFKSDMQKDMVLLCAKMFKTLKRKHDLHVAEKSMEDEHYDELLKLNKAPNEEEPLDMGESGKLTDEQLAELLDDATS